MIKKKPLVVIDFPIRRSMGLGNLLFIWARGVAYAHRYNLDYHTKTWFKIYFFKSFFLSRWERRVYFTSFKRKTNYRKYIYCYCFGKKIIEPSFSAEPDLSKPSLLFFRDIPEYWHYFRDIKPFRAHIIWALNAMLHKKVWSDIEQQPEPVIAVHIRHGDFPVADKNLPFKKQGQRRTPMDYFIKLIDKIRNISGYCLPVTIFTDGKVEDLKEVLALPQTNLARSRKYDISDIILMSKSKLLIVSAGSTFSFWGGFLGNMPIINHFEHLHEDLRDKKTNDLWFEGGVDPDSDEKSWPALLIKNIKDIDAHQAKNLEKP